MGTKRLPFAIVQRRIERLSQPRQIYRLVSSQPKTRVNVRSPQKTVAVSRSAHTQHLRRNPSRRKITKPVSVGQVSDDVSLEKILMDIVDQISLDLAWGIFEGMDENRENILSIVDFFDAIEMMNVALKDSEFGILLHQYLVPRTQHVDYKKFFADLRKVNGVHTNTNPVIEALSKCIQTMNATAPDAPELQTLHSLLEHQVNQMRKPLH